MNQKWLNSPIKDDPVLQSNVAGVINFADAGPNTRSTELVFMLGDNTKQDKKGFAPFGKITTAAGLATARAVLPVEGGCTGSLLTIRVNLYVLEVDVADGATQARILATVTVGWWTHTAVPVRNR